MSNAADLLRWSFATSLGIDGHPSQLTFDGSPEHLRRALRFHRGWGMLHAQRGAVRGVPADILASCRAHVDRIWLQDLALHADLAHAGSALAASKVDWVAFKGPVLADLHYPSAGLRPYQDLDLLVPPRDLRAAIDALESAGWHLLDRNWTLSIERMVGELHLTGPRGTALDLHWSVHNRRLVRERSGVRTSDLLADAMAIELNGVAARTLSWADSLVHLATHASAGGADRLLWLADIHAVARSPAADWNELAQRARAWGAAPATALALDRARRIFGSTAQPDQIRRLDPRAWTWGARWLIDTAFPVARRRTPLGPAHRWARAMTPGHSGWPSWRRVTGGRSAAFVESATNPGSLLFDSGGEAGRERFLDAVAGQG